jgi:hypothetical protein
MICFSRKTSVPANEQRIDDFPKNFGPGAWALSHGASHYIL